MNTVPVGSSNSTRSGEASEMWPSRLGRSKKLNSGIGIEKRASVSASRPGVSGKIKMGVAAPCGQGPCVERSAARQAAWRSSSLVANTGGAAVSTEPCSKPVRSTCKNQQISSAGMASERVRLKRGPAEGSALDGTEVAGEARFEAGREGSDMAQTVPRQLGP